MMLSIGQHKRQIENGAHAGSSAQLSHSLNNYARKHMRARAARTRENNGDNN